MGILPFVLVTAVLGLIAFGGTWLLADPTFVLVCGSLCGGAVAAIFGHARYGGTRAFRDLRGHVPVFVVTTLLTALLYLPLGYIGGWFWTGLPTGAAVTITFVAWIALMAVFTFVSQYLPPAAAFPWAPLIAVGSAFTRWGFALIEQARSNPTSLGFVGTPPAWAEVVYSGASLLHAVTVTAVLVTAIIGFCKLRDNGIWWHGFPADNCVSIWQSGSSIRRFAMSFTGEPVAHRTPWHLINNALVHGDFEPIEHYQLHHALAAPDVDTSNWDLQDWDDHFGGQNFLDRVGSWLDITAYADPWCNCLPNGVYPGLPGFTVPYTHVETGLEVMHDGQPLSPHIMDLRPSAPISIWSETITVEHGFELSCRASYRMVPALLPRVAHCKGRQAIINDRVKHALNQIMKLVGPWMYGFVGAPLDRGSLQRGLVASELARRETPFTRATSMMTRPLRADDRPQLIDADRPAFFAVMGIVYNLHIQVLRETGMWILPGSLQIDDVDVDPQVRQMLMAAVKAVIMASVAPELRTVQFVAVEAKMGGVVAALQNLQLSDENRAEILKESAKLLHASGGNAAVTDIIQMAGTNLAIRVPTGGGGEKK